MKKTMASLALLSLLTAACGSNSSSGTSTPTAQVSTKKEDMKLTELTDRSQCYGAPTIRDTPFQTWKAVHKGVGLESGIEGTLTMRVTFSRRGASITNTCSFNGESGFASIEVDGLVNENSRTIELFGSKSDSKKVGNVTCSVTSNPGKFNYEIVGNCLKATSENEPGSTFFVSDDGN